MLTGAFHLLPSTPLREVPFCVVDLETTGGAPATDAITEIGAVRLLGGTAGATLHTFVHPGTAIPARISYLTGITQAMVAHAPRPESVLPTFLEFARGAVIVGHNVRFDLGFLNAALHRAGHGVLEAPAVDTCLLARRLVRDEVPDCRLATLAQRLRLDHQPAHRALPDALATADLLHLLIERAASYGVFSLDDLLALPRLARHPHADKLRLTDALPRSPGVYEFLDRNRQVIYVGKATNLRQRTRSYFGSDDRRSIRPLLAQLHEIRHHDLANPLAAGVAELRMLHAERPRFNRAGGRARRPTWLRLTAEPFPRFTTSSRPQPVACSLGPFATLAAARRAQEAIETVIPIRRCTARARASGPTRTEPCTPAVLGVAHCPCAATVTAAEYAVAADSAQRVLTVDPGVVLRALEMRMTALAADQRFEEGALARDRGRALARAHGDRRAHLALIRAGHLALTIADSTVTIRNGVLLGSQRGTCVDVLPPTAWAAGDPPLDHVDPAHSAESRLIVAWLIRAAGSWTTGDAEHDAGVLGELEAARPFARFGSGRG